MYYNIITIERIIIFLQQHDYHNYYNNNDGEKNIIISFFDTLILKSFLDPCSQQLHPDAS